jgi:hypothetical protein
MYAHLGVSFHTWPVVDLQKKQVLTKQPDEFYRMHGVYVGESYYVSAEDLCRRIIVDAVENKVAEESEGALVIYTHGKDRPPLMLVKKDGATSYHARDMAAALYRKRHWPFEEMTYVVGGEQKLHFEQLFKALEMLGHEWAANCHHVDFGVLLFKQADGKWAKTSTRRGTSILLEQVLDEAIASVREIMQAKNPELASSPDGEAVAQAVGVGAVVFNDLKNGRRNNVKFDWDAVLDFSPYFSFYYNTKRYLFFLPLRWILRYDIRTDQYLKSVDCPVHIIHGTNDRLISFSQSEKLYALYPDKIVLHKIEGARHNNLPEFAEFFEILYEILYVKPKSETA